MITSLQNMPENARVWVYQSDRELTTDEKLNIGEQTIAFLSQWAAHGQALQAAFEIRDNRFLVIAVNEQVHAASGCSIDASVAFVRSLGQTFQIDFFNRTNVAFIVNNEVQIVPLPHLKAKIQNGEIPENSLVVNNAITTKRELDTIWKAPLAQSWAARYLPQLQTK